MRTSIEEADAARSDQQADNDEDDAPEELPPEQRENAGDHQYNSENPEKQFHEEDVYPSPAKRKPGSS